MCMLNLPGVHVWWLRGVQEQEGSSSWSIWSSIPRATGCCPSCRGWVVCHCYCLLRRCHHCCCWSLSHHRCFNWGSHCGNHGSGKVRSYPSNPNCHLLTSRHLAGQTVFDIGSSNHQNTGISSGVTQLFWGQESKLSSLVCVFSSCINKVIEKVPVKKKCEFAKARCHEPKRRVRCWLAKLLTCRSI